MVNILSHFSLKSYVKTLLIFLGLLAVILLLDELALLTLPTVIATAVILVGAVFALGAAVLATASAVVLIRQRRMMRGAPDLFLRLNRSREAAAIAAAGAARVSGLRRWLARRLLGHELVVGDIVEIRPWSEIRATLDDQGCLDQLPFMREMLPMCGQRMQVFRGIHRIFDYRKTRRMRHMHGAVLLIGAVCDGQAHGGCEAVCHTIWKAAWLRRVETAAAANKASSREPAASASDPTSGTDLLTLGTSGPRFTCQLTQLHNASEEVDPWSVRNFFRPLVSGNVAPAAFAIGWLTHLFNQFQYFRGGVDFPAVEPPAKDQAKPVTVEVPLLPRDEIIVRTVEEITATLNDKQQHRGLWLEPDMLKFCGNRIRVRSQVKNIIDIVSGEMLTMKTPAYILQDVHFSGERQLFNAQYEPLFWRSAWLRKVETPAAPQR